MSTIHHRPHLSFNILFQSMAERNNKDLLVLLFIDAHLKFVIYVFFCHNCNVHILSYLSLEYFVICTFCLFLSYFVICIFCHWCPLPILWDLSNFVMILVILLLMILVILLTQICQSIVSPNTYKKGFDWKLLGLVTF